MMFEWLIKVVYPDTNLVEIPPLYLNDTRSEIEFARLMSVSASMTNGCASLLAVFVYPLISVTIISLNIFSS